MRYASVSALLPVLLLVALVPASLTGCQMAGASMSAGTSSGMAVTFSSYGDFLYTGPGSAYTNNRKGIKQFVDGDYAGARDTFGTTLASHPGNPDAVYYYGLCQIYLGQRDAGFARLASYNDPDNFRINQEVRWWANYCAKKPELTPEKIREVMNKARGEGYRRQIQEDWEFRGWGW